LDLLLHHFIPPVHERGKLRVDLIHRARIDARLYKESADQIVYL
jgi:hypothetical protein